MDWIELTIHTTTAGADIVSEALMAEGDLAAGEMDVPVEWLTRLAEQGRARYIEPGLW